MDRSGSPPYRWYQFSLRTVLLVMVLVALLVGWWCDRVVLQHQAQSALQRLNNVTSVAGSTVVGGGSPIIIEPLDLPPEAFVERLRSIKDWYEFSDRTADRFVRGRSADDAIPLLVAALKDPDLVVRYRAASTLGRLGDVAGPGTLRSQRAETIVPALIPLLKDECPNVRWHAACALRAFGTDAVSAIPAIREQSENDASPIAAAATIFLHEMEREEYETRLIVLLANPGKDNRERAIHELGHLNSPRGMLALKDAYGHEPDPNLQDAITEILLVRQQKLAQANLTPP